MWEVSRPLTDFGALDEEKSEQWRGENINRYCPWCNSDSLVFSMFSEWEEEIKCKSCDYYDIRSVKSNV